jgi:hypothetical protein
VVLVNPTGAPLDVTITATGPVGKASCLNALPVTLEEGTAKATVPPEGADTVVLEPPGQAGPTPAPPGDKPAGPPPSGAPGPPPGDG